MEDISGEWFSENECNDRLGQIDNSSSQEYA